jgi:hypothetical protein
VTGKTCGHSISSGDSGNKMNATIDSSDAKDSDLQSEAQRILLQQNMNKLYQVSSILFMTQGHCENRDKDVGAKVSPSSGYREVGIFRLHGASSLAKAGKTGARKDPSECLWVGR